MKIGILTLPFNNNYGGLLQSLALQKIMKDRGHEVILINMPSVKKYSFKGKIKKFLMDITFQSLKHRQRLNKISINMISFVNENMTITEIMYNDSDFQSLKNYNFDFFIVGSDQVWRFDYTKHRFARYFFDFLYKTDFKRLSFAASFGVDYWNRSPEDTALIANLLSKFEAVSVREESGVNLCKTQLNIEAVHILDPTLYLKPAFYESLIKGKILDFQSSKDSILYYILDIDDDKKRVIKEVSELLNISKIYKAGVKSKGPGKYSSDMIYPTVYQWLYDFMNCKFVVTDSFHGCVFSIIFNKPFVVYANKGRGVTRFDSLLKTFELENRIIFSSNDLAASIVESTIDYDRINVLLTNLNVQMIDFLSKNGL